MERPERPESGPGLVREAHGRGESDKRNRHLRPTVIFQDILREKQKIHNENKDWCKAVIEEVGSSPTSRTTPTRIWDSDSSRNNHTCRQNRE